MNQAPAHKLSFSVKGQGKPVIMLHGMMSSGAYWNSVSKIIGDKRQLITPDLLGHGKSPKPRKGSYNMPHFIDCLDVTFQDYEFSEPPILVGHSLGAMIAINWSLRHPEKFKSIILSAPVLFEDEKFKQQVASIALKKNKLTGKKRANIIVKLMGISGLFPTTLATKLYKSYPIEVIKDATKHRYFVYKKLLSNEYFKDQVISDLKELKVPTVIVIGQNDLTSVHAKENLELVCKENNLCSLNILPTGHQIPLESPQKIAEAILSV